MLRLVELALFLAPFAAFAAWRFLATEGGPSTSLVVAAACVLALLAAALLWLSQDKALAPGADYEPARLEQGKVVFGPADPQR
ncbi:MAG TPA: DUF6111 family protein [Acetobacteraceae bacterium]|nr:DUF6111 family protein [Acetobacteraceae bacterium]